MKYTREQITPQAVELYYRHCATNRVSGAWEDLSPQDQAVWCVLAAIPAIMPPAARLR